MKIRKSSGVRPWGSREKVATGMNMSVALLSAAAIVLMLNYICARYLYVRADVSSARFYSLSDKTVEVLAGLDSPVDVYVVFTSDEADVADDIMSLLKEYRYAANRGGPDRLRVERVDPVSDVSRTEALQRKYGLTEADVVVFDAAGRTKVVPEREIVEYASSFLEGPERKVSFRGEQLFTSAILELTQEEKPAVYFVRGHGERDAADFTENVGYSSLSRIIEFDNISVRSLFLTEAMGIPEDCRALVIAGPKERFLAGEVQLIGEYLGANRALMLLLEAGYETGLEPLLEEWGVKVPREVVLDPMIPVSVSGDRRVPLGGTGEELYVRAYGDHDVTRRLRGIVSVLYLPAPVIPIDGALVTDAERDRARAYVLAASSPGGWGETDFDQDPPVFDPASDRKGPIPVCVAVERGVRDVELGLEPTRMVVFGDATFVANGRLAGGNVDFFMSSLNWLLDRGPLMVIGPKRYGLDQLTMDRRQVAAVFVIATVLIPAMAVILGLGVWFKRSR